MKKTYSKTKKSCRVTFRLPAEIKGEDIALCGEFNNWNETTHMLKRRKDGSFSTTVSLKPGEYRFRYLIDGKNWENDWVADAYVPNAFGAEDSIVKI